MGTVLAYFIKAGCCLAVFYLFYKWLLSKDTFHHFNRFVLLSLLLISAALPFLQINLHTTVQQAQFLIGNLMMEVVNETNNTPIFQWQWLLIITYLVGCLCYATITFISYLKLYKTIHNFPSKPLTDNSRIRLIVTDKEISSFSWMNYIVISKTDYKENGDAIITHEKAHIRYKHTIDILIADICIMLQWFNPAAWLIKKELQNIHEFEADDAVLKAGICAKNYQLLLIKKAVGTRLYSMANSFNHSSLKKRITMMLKEKSNPWARLKYIYVLPLAALSVTTFASTEVSNPLGRLSQVKVSDLSAYFNQNAEKSVPSTLRVASESNRNVLKLQTTPVVESGDPVSPYAYKMPQYPGGMKVLISFIAANLTYPASAQASKTQGKVIVQFIVGKDGKIRDARVVRRLSDDCDAEALRVVNKMSNWIPGEEKGGKKVSVKYTIPIQFSLSKDVKSETTNGVLSTREENVNAEGGDVYEMADKMPSFPGGNAKMLEYLFAHMRYPKDASKQKQEGRVIVQFIVDKSGDVRDVKIVRPVSSSLDQEAVRIVSSMPRWTPGEQDGKAVSCKFTLPISFKLDGGKRTSNVGTKKTGLVAIGHKG